MTTSANVRGCIRIRLSAGGGCSVFEETPLHDGVGRELWDIISTGRVRTLLQPVVPLDGGPVIGYEALSRGPAGSPLEFPDKLFSAGRDANLLYSLERVCRRKALLAKNRFLSKEQILFLNIDPQVVYGADYQADIAREVMSTLGIEPEEVVLELTERFQITDFQGFAAALERYLGHGYKVAVDDVGSGYSNLRLIAEIKPDFIKVDMSLIRNIDKDETKQALLETLVSLARKVDAAVIAEGVETAEELAVLVSLGVGFAQGYFLARPAETPPEVSREAIAVIRLEAEKRRSAEVVDKGA